jgi:hypothetical protein
MKVHWCGEYRLERDDDGATRLVYGRGAAHSRHGEVLAEATLDRDGFRRILNLFEGALDWRYAPGCGVAGLSYEDERRLMAEVARAIEEGKS